MTGISGTSNSSCIDYRITSRYKYVLYNSLHTQHTHTQSTKHACKMCQLSRCFNLANSVENIDDCGNGGGGEMGWRERERGGVRAHSGK